MGTVYLARDLKHDRLVALKVLHPDLASTLGPERFLREIKLAARLQHPHILAVYDSGDASGLLWYATPYIEGESLRAKLGREGELPIPEAIQILRAVTDALAYAHRHGVVHRDIKPDNVLLSGGHAIVADFGIAKAVGGSSSDSSTSIGVALGTPAYMSPEQVAADPQVDHRADIYAVGVVAYEMLCGRTPFIATTPQALLAAHLSQIPDPLVRYRTSISAGLNALVLRCLEKHPADRWQTADEVLRSLDSVSTEAPLTRVTEKQREPVSYRWLIVASFVAVALTGAVTVLRDRSRSVVVDPGVIAVVPFRVTGADSSLRYLREGMLDLVAAKLSRTNLRTVDPRTMLHAWQRAGGSAGSDIDRTASLQLARKVGAGRLLEGEVIGTPLRLILNARLSDAAGTGESRASIEGPSDSLTSLVDRLAAQLLALTAQEGRDRLAALTTTSLPALREYLDGQAAYRRGAYSTARDLFDRAIIQDSTFALAVVGHAKAGSWLGVSFASARLALRHRDRLPKRDLLFLYAMLGRDGKQDLDNAEALVAGAPDDPEAWAALGDRTFHYGTLGAIPDAVERSGRAYERALKLDSSYSPSLEHLYEIHYLMDDTAASRRALALLVREKAHDAEPPVRWFARRFLADTTLGTLTLADDSLVASTWEVVRLSLRYVGGFVEAESLLHLRSRKVVSEAERRGLQRLSWTFYVIRGQPKRALTQLPSLADPVHRAAIVLDAIFANGDSAVASKVVATIPRTYPRPTVRTTWQNIVERYAAAQYDLIQGRSGASRDAVRAWSGVRILQDTSQALRLASHLALLLDTQLAVRGHRSDALARLKELDSLLQTVPSYGGYLTDEHTFGGFEPIANLVAARLWEDRGELARALAAVRRRAEGFLPPAVYIAQLRDEARYAARTGDREGATRAYRHYLALRKDAEPGLQGQVHAARAELEALRREPTDR